MAVDSNKPIRVGLMSLGCAKNLVDAEIMLGSLLQEGVEITNDAAAADVVIVNTCSFIDSAQEESVDAILEASALRDQRNPGQGLIVSGCLPQRFREELPKLLPEVDAFMGVDQVAQVGQIVRQALELRQAKQANPPARTPRKKVTKAIADADKTKPSDHDDGANLRGTEAFGRTRKMAAPAGPLIDVNLRPSFIPDVATPRFRLTPKHFAYVKIAEGCNHPCSFCIIPRMRGSHRSRQQSDVAAEARGLIAEGVRELNLISQDSTYYGLDLRENHSRAISSPQKFTAATRALPESATTLCTLLRELNGLDGDFWIRLLYTHPAHWTDELISTIATSAKVARYVDMPLQHIHETMLERMRRETSREYIVDLIRRIRAGIPGITLRTTFIVGFPGETEECFESLLEFIRETQFERLGVFTYSHQDGTRAASMAKQVPEEVRNERRDRAMAEQLKIAQSLSARAVGTTLKVLVEGEASVAELKKAQVSSWEHGLIRDHGAKLSGMKGRFAVARSQGDAPDIDGRVYVKGKLPIGAFAQVRVIGSTDYDLIAEPL